MNLEATNGARNRQAKLTAEQARYIYLNRHLKAKQLADQFGVHHSVVYRVWNRTKCRDETQDLMEMKHGDDTSVY